MEVEKVGAKAAAMVVAAMVAGRVEEETVVALAVAERAAAMVEGEMAGGKAAGD